MDNGSTTTLRNMPEKAVVHPLVLLSVVDHYSRVAKDTDKRVVGVLLGTTHKGVVDITNSYAVPFEEDPKNPETWYFDHNYHEAMFAMFRKVNSSERVVGWYSTGPLLRPSDLQIHEVLRQYTSEPILTIVNVNNRTAEVPARCYLSLPCAPDADSTATRAFTPLPVSVGAEEAEEVGVEHLLRDVRGAYSLSLGDAVAQRIRAVSTLQTRLETIYQYLNDCAKGSVRVDSKIIQNAQSILALVPDVANPELVSALQAKQADNTIVMYVGHIVRVVTGLHDLIKNKALNRDAERDEKAKAALIAATQKAEEEGDNDEGEDDMDTVGEASAE